MRQLWRIAGLVVPIAWAIGGACAFAEPRIGTVVQKSFKGAVGTRVAASTERLYFGHEVFAQETVTTPANGATVMRFHDQTQLQVGANSTVVLDRFVYDPNADSSDASIKFAKGVFRYIAGQAKTEENIKLSTPTTTLTIRGTKFLVYVADDGATTVSVIEGAVDVQPCGPAKPTNASEGQIYHVSPSCDVTQVAFAPVDPAIVSDYSTTEDNGGLTGPGSSGKGSTAAGPPAAGPPAAGPPAAGPPAAGPPAAGPPKPGPKPGSKPGKGPDSAHKDEGHEKGDDHHNEGANSPS
jgi:FecR protein